MIMSGALALRSYALIDHRHWFLRSNNNLYCMQVTYLAVGCSHHVNISKILAVRKRCNETRLSNVILSCHFVLSFIREARNFNSVCCNCCYGTTGASLTARRAACAHTYVTCVCIPDTTGRGHATRTRSTCFVRELRHPNLPQQKARQRPAPRAPRANGWDPVWTAPARRGCPSRTASRRYPRSRGDSLAPSRPRQRPEPLAPANCWDPVWAPQARRVAGICPAHARRLRAGARSARRARRGSRVAACIAVARAPRFPAARLSASAVLWAQELRSRGAVP